MEKINNELKIRFINNIIDDTKNKKIIWIKDDEDEWRGNFTTQTIFETYENRIKKCYKLEIKSRQRLFIVVNTTKYRFLRRNREFVHRIEVTSRDRSSPTRPRIEDLVVKIVDTIKALERECNDNVLKNAILKIYKNLY